MPAAAASDRSFADRAVVGAVLVALFAYSLLETMIAPALPEIRLVLGATPAQLGLVFTGLFLAGAVSTPLIGALADLFPKRIVMVVTLAIVIAGAALAGAAGSIVTLALGQVLQGVGLGMVPLAVGLLGESLPKDKVSFGNGLMVAVLMSSTAIGLLLAGSIVQLLGFRGIYGLALALLVPCALVVSACARADRPRPVGPRARVDWAGAVFLALWLIALLTGLALGPEHGWTSPRVLVLLAGAAALAGAWVVFERRRERPLIDLQLVARPAVALVCLVGFAAGFASISAYVLVPLLLQAQFHADAGAVGLYLLPMGLGGLTAGPLAAPLGRRLGVRAPLMLGTIVLAASVALPVAWRDQGWHVLASMTCLGVGAGLVLAQALNILVRAVGTAHAAGVSGLFFVIRSIGGTVGSQISATLLGTATSAGGVVAASGYTQAFAVATAVALVGVAAAALLPKLPQGGPR
jgi:MFS family permease